MKTIIFSLFISSLTTTASLAQIRLGPFLGYGEGINRWGIGAYTELVLNDRISISPNFTLYFPDNFDSNPRRAGWEFNLNMNYYVVSGDVGYLYGLAGPSYLNIRTRTSTPATDITDNDANFGLNVGIGTMVNVNDSFYPFAEAKYTVGSYSQGAVIFGVKFPLGRESLEYDY